VRRPRNRSRFLALEIGIGKTCVGPRIPEGLHSATQKGKTFIAVLICNELDENLDVLKRYEHKTRSTESQRRSIIHCVSSVLNCCVVHSSCQLSARNNISL
jgi:hypothetical protein